MKNKKLFAILTLVCFMFTLMPVAAFAADTTVYVDVQEDSAVVEAGTQKIYADVVTYDANNKAVKVDNTKFYAFFMQGETVYEKAGFPIEVTANKGVIELAAIADPAEYELVVVPMGNKSGANNLKRIYNAADNYAKALIDADEAAAIMMAAGAADVNVVDGAVVVDSTADVNYKVTILDGAKVTVSADNGYTSTDVIAKVTTAAGKPVAGQEVSVKSGSPAVTVVADSLKTDAAGIVKFKLIGSIAGTFEVDVKFADVKATVEVTVKGLRPATITKVAEPTAPIVLKTTLDKSGVYFNVKDANGNNVAPGKVNVVVVEQPAGSKINGKTIQLKYVAGKGYGFDSTQKFAKEGTYTFRVMLENGASATATVEVKKFVEPVELKLVYPVTAVELNGVIVPEEILFVDENGVTEDASDDVVLSANGYAVAGFKAATGEVTVKANESYVGSKITVLAVAKEYPLTATAVLTVANEAAAVKFVDTKADVAVNNTLVANIVDVDGNKVALNNKVDTAAEIQYIVLDKPADAKVAITTSDASELETAGKFKVSFTASEIGTYKVQTVVRYEQAGQNAKNPEPVVKYYSGIEEITVGNTGFKDIVVLSVGSNEIVVNAATKAIDAAPIVENNRTFVPFRALAEAFGATVAFDEATQAVTAELNGTTVVMTIGSAEYTVNGVAKTMDVAPFINASSTMIPVRFVAEEFGISVTPTYDENGATADILFAK